MWYAHGMSSNRITRIPSTIAPINTNTCGRHPRHPRSREVFSGERFRSFAILFGIGSSR
jgi:hypothetical protein